MVETGELSRLAARARDVGLVAALGFLDCLRRQAAVRGRTAVCADVATARPVEGTGTALVAKATMVKPKAEPASTTAARSRASPVRTKDSSTPTKCAKAVACGSGSPGPALAVRNPSRSAARLCSSRSATSATANSRRKLTTAAQAA